jgi:hypothetical protein
MTSRLSLDAELQKLQETAKTQDKLHHSARRMLWQTLVESYFWWLEAKDKPGYLKAQCANAKIKYDGTENYPNFNPVLKLIFGKNTHNAAKISQWSSAINAIDDEYLRNGHIYKHRNPAEELVNWITDNNGLAGITGRKKEEVEEKGYNYKEEKGKKAKAKNNKYAIPKRDEEFVELLKKSAGLDNNEKRIDLGPIGTGENDFVVILAKSTGNGNELRVLGTTAQQDLVDEALKDVKSVSYAHVSKALRMICEAIQLNTITKTSEKYGARPKFFSETKLTVFENGREKKIRENVRLVMRRDGTILVSKSSTDASLATYYVPHEREQLDQDYWLRGMDRYWLETEMINAHGLLFYDADEPETKKEDNHSVRTLKIRAKDSKHSRNIYFYDFSKIDPATMYQPTVTDDDIQYDWSICGDVAFFKTLYEQHFAGWQHRIKHRVHTSNNKAIAFDVTEHGITCEKKWDNTQGLFTQSGSRYLTPFSDIVQANGHGRIIFSPTDIIAALEMIAKQKIKDEKVTMAANADVLHLSFENDLAQVSMYIPACGTNGRRSSKYFRKYAPNDS